jgi:O-acetyl-ADP-ribose deacetylase (regulator of RNase III)
MIHYLKGNILESQAEALVNTVNTQGIMGKGIALQFKKAYPSNFKSYFEASKKGELQIGKLFVNRDRNIVSGEKLIINFPTKKDWRKPSEYAYIDVGLDDLIRVIEEYRVKSLAIPPLGSGNGGLEWQRVKKMIEEKLSPLNIDIFVYEPTKEIVDHLRTERVKLTNARALLLYVLYDLVKNGEFVSEFSSEKVCYFLQRFGGRKYFKLTYKPKFYGPYSGKVRYLLNALNGSYIAGYSDMDKRPFEPLTLSANGYETVKNYIESDESLHAIARKTITLLSGFYSDFALELLSSIDYIANKTKSLDKEIVSKELAEWSDRKRTLFTNPKYLDISIKQLSNSSFAN